MITVDYKVPNGGEATDFTDAERPIIYAKEYLNRYVNINGRAERRPGMGKFSGSVPGQPNLTRIHEWVGPIGTESLLSSDDNGSIYKYSVTASAWSVALTGKQASRILSAQAQDYLIFVNGLDRNFYTKDGGQTFHELLPIISRGTEGSGTTTGKITDALITSWLNQTYVANNDIVWNVTRNGYGIVTNVSGQDLYHTTIGTAGNGSGRTSANQAVGDTYAVLDHVAMNLFTDSAGNETNIAIATTGTLQNVIAVSGTTFSNTEIRVGDFVYNTTRGCVTQITTVSANVNVTLVSAQTASDSLVFIKSAMPIATYIHVHYGRVCFIDSRDQTRVVFTAPDSPEDVTTFAKTLNSSSYQFGSQQPQGDTLSALGTFQNYFIAAGQRNLYVFNGTTPVTNDSTDTLDFSPVSFFPNGLVSRFGLSNNGNNAVYMSPNGLQSISVQFNSLTTQQDNISIVNRDDFRYRIKNTNPDSIQVVYYPRRQWLLCQIGSRIWNFNTSPVFDANGAIALQGTWTPFEGKFAQQNHYFVRRNGDLVCCGIRGQVYLYDDGSYTDDGDIITTRLTTARYFLEEPARSVRIKRGYYIRPLFESGGNISYTITANGGWENISTDTITIPAQGGNQIGSGIVGAAQIGGSGVQATKAALRWYGENVELVFETNTSAGPDIISGYTLYGSLTGRR